MRTEFVDKNAVDSCDTMVLAGGHGRKQLDHFYGKYFIPRMPPDIENERVLPPNTLLKRFVNDPLL